MIRAAPDPASHADPRGDEAGARNLLLLAQLRWLAILGQLAAILVARFVIGAPLPLVAMLAILAGLVMLNVATLGALRWRREMPMRALFWSLVVDWAALAALLFLSGGATNPFAPIGFLQIVLGAVLLDSWHRWALVALHSVSFGLLVPFHDPLRLPAPYHSELSAAHMLAGWANFVLASVLIVLLLARISQNLRARDRRLAELRQRAAEEDHIVRMGLLASGAAHELGTPLSQVSVILGDWAHQPGLMRDASLAEEIGEMRAAVARCKAIVGGILYASGEMRSEAVERTTLAAFLYAIAGEWDGQRPGLLAFDDALHRPIAIAADRTLVQVVHNLLDNAAEAGASRIELRVSCDDGTIEIAVRDDGPGFAPDILASIGRPYRSTKERLGAGLGLFLAVNVLRKLGGRVEAGNPPGGGALVRLLLPVAALTLENA